MSITNITASTSGTKAPPPPAASNVYLSFQGIGFTSGKVRTFEAICGPKPPTPTGGYGVWDELARPLSDSLTIYQGRGPAALSINIIFGAWLGGWRQDDSTGHSIENDIGTLEWMAGQGFHYGPSPVVYIDSNSTQGGTTDLIPAAYRGMPWILPEGIQWGDAYRNPNGYRVWQEATFTVKNYLNLSAPPQKDATIHGGYFVSRPGRDTAGLIASAPSAKSPMVDHKILAGRICENPKNNPCKATSIRLRRKSLHWQIRHGVHVWVPSHQIV